MYRVLTKTCQKRQRKVRIVIPVDTNRMQTVTTGNVNPVMAWVVSADGSRHRSDVQAEDDRGRPLWAVEILRQTTVFGEGRTSAVPVQVPADQMPSVASMGPTQFQGLEADFYVSKGQLRERWTAEGIEPAAAQRSAPKQAEDK